MKTHYQYRHGHHTQSASAAKNSVISDAAAKSPVAGGVIIGKLVGFTAASEALIAYDLETSQQPLQAISVVPVSDALLGAEVVLSFADNRQQKPVIMGIVQSHYGPDMTSTSDATKKETVRVEEAGIETAAAPIESAPELLINGEKINISAAKEITLRCGKSSITLTEQGKILIKGEHILSRASGANRVRGGSIQLN